MNLRHILCIIFMSVSFLILIKCYKKSETFIAQSFDDILDNKCLIESDNLLDNYLMSTGQCIKNTCPSETCNRLYYDTRLNEHYFISETLPKQEVPSSDGVFTCKSKESIDNNIYCSTPPPLCPMLGFTDVCHVYNCNDMQWVAKNYKKMLDENGNCSWRDMSTGNVVDDEYLATCKKQPLDCSLCNVPCSTLPQQGVSFLDNYQKYKVSVDGNSCEIDPSYSCFECDETLTKTAYKLNTHERRYEPRIYRQQVAFGGKCVYKDERGYCHPDHNMEIPQCFFEDNVSATKVDCLDYEYRFCCNLDDRDFFDKTKYRPVLSADGTRCVYTTVDKSLSREIELDANFGFNCPGYEFKLCQDSNQFRNENEQKCTPCLPGRYMVDNTQFTDSQACEDLPDCTGSFDYCYEDLNEAGTVQIRKSYEKIPTVISSQDGSRPTAQCMESTPQNCKKTCAKPVVIENGGATTSSDIYCDLCPGDTELNPLNFKCEKKIDCPSERKECLDRHDNTFYWYNKQQEDPFSQCMYVKEGDPENKIEISDCTDKCPPEYYRVGNTCEIPECVFTSNIQITYKPGTTPINITDDEKIRIFDEIELNEDIRYDDKYCKIDRMYKTIDVSSRVADATTCQVKVNSYGYVDKGDIYRTNMTLYNDEPGREPEIRTGAGGNCPVDCEYSIQPTNTDNKCRDRDNGNRTIYGPLPDYNPDSSGTTLSTHSKIKEQKHHGMSCYDAKLQLKQNLSRKNYVKEADKGDRVEFEYPCTLEPATIDCLHTEVCTNCQDRGLCSFKKQCYVDVSRQAFGTGKPCPINAGQLYDVNCPQSCGNCQEKSEWVYEDPTVNDFTWDSIQKDDTSSKIYRRFRKTTEKCLLNGVPRDAGVIIETEQKTVPQRDLDQSEINAVCNDDANFTWDPDLNNVCNCLTDVDTLIQQNGTYTPTTSRGIPVECQNRVRTASCSEVYVSARCERERGLEQNRRDKERACTDPSNWSWTDPICPTDCSYNIEISKNKIKGRLNEVSTGYSTLECSSYTIPNARIPKKNCDRYKASAYCIAQAQRLAAMEAAEEERRKQMFCQNVDNWNWVEPACSPDCTYSDILSLPFIRGSQKYNTYDCSTLDQSVLPARNNRIANKQCTKTSTYCEQLQNEAYSAKLGYCEDVNNWTWNQPSCPADCSYTDNIIMNHTRNAQKDTSQYDCSDIPESDLPSTNGSTRSCDNKRISPVCDPCNLRDDTDSRCDDMYAAIKCLLST